jgi:hypothetical protein
VYWGSSAANTNASYYLTNWLARYVANRIKVDECPCDTILSDNGDRLGSISMNCQMMGATSLGFLTTAVGASTRRSAMQVAVAVNGMDVL